MSKWLVGSSKKEDVRLFRRSAASARRVRSPPTENSSFFEERRRKGHAVENAADLALVSVAVLQAEGFRKAVVFGQQAADLICAFRRFRKRREFCDPL